MVYSPWGKKKSRSQLNEHTDVLARKLLETKCKSRIKLPILYLADSSLGQ